jgi:hypothetical protein
VFNEETIVTAEIDPLGQAAQASIGCHYR